MASVSLTDVWVHDGGNLNNYLLLGAASLIERPTNPSGTRRYSGGRYRLISVTGVQKFVDLVVDLPERDLVDTLRGWVGKLVLVRDPFGRKVWATLRSMDVEEVPMADATKVYRVFLPFEEVTVEEAV